MTRLRTRSRKPNTIENESERVAGTLYKNKDNATIEVISSTVTANKSMWRLVYLFLLFVRVYFAVSPSYLHPDEIFQGPEPLAGMVQTHRLLDIG